MDEKNIEEYRLPGLATEYHPNKHVEQDIQVHGTSTGHRKA